MPVKGLFTDSWTEKTEPPAVVIAAERLWREAQAEIFGIPSARGNIKNILDHLGRCGENPAVNTPLPAVLRALDKMDDHVNATKEGRKYGLPKVTLIESNSDSPTASPKAVIFSRTEASLASALHGIFPFLRIDGSAHTVPRSVPGGNGDVCNPAPKSHHKSLAPRG